MSITIKSLYCLVTFTNSFSNNWWSSILQYLHQSAVNFNTNLSAKAMLLKVINMIKVKISLITNPSNVLYTVLIENSFASIITRFDINVW